MVWGGNAILGIFCAAVSAVVFLFGLAGLIFSPGDSARPLILLVLWLPAGILALMSYRLLSRKGSSVPRASGSSVTDTTFGITTTTPRWQYVSLCALAVILPISFAMRGGDRKDTSVSPQSARRGDGSVIASRSDGERDVIGWRGADGEEMIVRPSLAKPSGEGLRLVNNPQASDPTYRKLIEFLRSDASDRRAYIDGQWVCANYAEEVHNRAEGAGLRCALVTIWFVDGEPHSCNLFRTVDRGLVYIDCTGSSVNEGPPNHDKAVEVEVGRSYVPRYLFPSEGWNDTVEPMGIVRDFTIHW
jgi:hypothetical protein